VGLQTKVEDGGPAQLEQVKLSLPHGRPLGDDGWVQRTAKRLGLLFTMADIARPKKQEE